MKNANQIRQLLVLIRYEIDNDIDSKATITKALALLPCETCNGTGEVLQEVEKTPNIKGVVLLTLPCPDCKSA